MAPGSGSFVTAAVRRFSEPRRRLDAKLAFAVALLAWPACFDPGDSSAHGESMSTGTGTTGGWVSTTSAGTTGSADTGAGAAEASDGTESGDVDGTEADGRAEEDSGGEEILAVEDRFSMYQGEAALERSPAEGLLVNDLLGHDEALFAEVVSATTDRGGRVEVDPSGGFVYEPPSAAFWGEDTFRYVATGPSGARSAGLVRIIVHPRTILQSQLTESLNVVSFAGESAIRTGHWVSGGGDLDGDGEIDVVVGNYQRPSDSNDFLTLWSGASGEARRLASDDLYPLGDAQASALPGDVNGDGIDDLVSGSPHLDAGQVYVVFGGARWGDGSIEELASSPGGFVISGEQDGDLAGNVVSLAGDVNGDGLADILLAAPQASVIGAEGEAIAGAGKYYVVHGKADASPIALSDVAAGRGGFVILGEDEGHGEFSTIAPAHDVNGDGLSDLVIGCRLANEQRGRAYVVFGKRDGQPIDLRLLATAGGGFVVECDEGRCGEAVAGAGDVNGDGLADILVGAPQFAAAEGAVLLVHGKMTEEPVTMNALKDGVGGLFIQGTSGLWTLGGAVGAAGDVNADGLADVVVAAPWAWTNSIIDDPNGYLQDEGIAYVLFGRRDTMRVQTSDLLQGQGGFAVAGTVAWANLGYAVGTAGDIDGDGFSEVIIGAPGRFETTGGVVHVLSGGDYSLAATIRASHSGESLSGTDADDVLLGGRGDDVIESGGGVDVIYTGRGDDTIVLTDGRFFRVRGGPGEDTVRLGHDAELDLSGVPAFAFHGVEVLDLEGAGANSLVMEPRHFTADAGRRTLSIRGDEKDSVRVDLRGGAFEEEAARDGFVVYGNGNITLRIEADVPSTILLR